MYISLWTQIRIVRKEEWLPMYADICATPSLPAICLTYFIELTAKLSILNQYARLLCYPLLLQSAYWDCAVSFTAQSIFVWLCTVVKKIKSLSKCLVGKKMFLSQTVPCTKHTHTHFTGSCYCRCPTGWSLFREDVRYLTCWLREAFPVGLNIEKTLCCQSHMPANLWLPWHPTGNQWQQKIKIGPTFTISLKAFSLPIFP